VKRRASDEESVLSRPSGTCFVYARKPGAEAPGYWRSSLRDLDLSSSVPSG
jgi:hypothetical protein